MDYRDLAIIKMKEIFGNDLRRINHALKVLKFSEEILQGEKLSDKFKEIIVLAAIFHDIGIQEAEKKYNSNAGKFQEIEGPIIARRVLEDIGIDSESINRICYIIGGHHTELKNDGIDFQIIWESDLIVNIEEDELCKKGLDIEHVIIKNFKTITGVKIAKELFLK
jgi:hypothetical protein